MRDAQEGGSVMRWFRRGRKADDVVFSADDGSSGITNLYGHFAGELARRGEFYFWGEVTDGQCELAATFLRHALYTGQRMVTLFICSPGGSSDDMRALIATMELCKASGMIVRSFGAGLVASAAFDLFVACSKGYRYASETTMFMTHGTKGHVEEAEMFELQREFDRYTYRQYTNITEATQRKFLRTGNWWFDAETAVRYGACDGVVRAGESIPDGATEPQLAREEDEA